MKNGIYGAFKLIWQISNKIKSTRSTSGFLLKLIQKYILKN